MDDAIKVYTYIQLSHDAKGGCLNDSDFTGGCINMGAAGWYCEWEFCKGADAM